MNEDSLLKILADLESGKPLEDIADRLRVMVKIDKNTKFDLLFAKINANRRFVNFVLDEWITVEERERLKTASPEERDLYMKCRGMKT